MSDRLPIPGPAVSPEEVQRLYPRLRQSILAKYDDCPLSCLQELRHAGGWSTHPQAAGTIFHRFAAEALRIMRQTGETQIPVSEALEILYHVVRQKSVPLEDRVRVPLRDMEMLRTGVIKWASDNRFSIDRIVDIERRLFTTVPYDHERLGVIQREVTGQLDVLIFEPPDGAVVLDWKHTWALPPEKRTAGPEDPRNQAKRLSYEGYFQQRFYALLVMRNYTNIQRVALREFYHMRGKVRAAWVTREMLEHVEREIAILLEAFDDSAAVGTKMAGTGKKGDAWPASPGKHCDFCAKPGACPIEKEARGIGAVTNVKVAAQYAAEYVVASRVREHRRTALKAYAEVHGPVEVKYSKGRRVLGWNPDKNGGRNFEMFTPDESDRGPERDERLEQAMKDSVQEAREMREAAKAARKEKAA